MTNRKLGKYEVTERIGRGGMAEVYRAYHVSLDRFVAIKVLHAFLADDPEFKNRFEKEARNIARLKHPNIVQVYDFDYDSDSESYYMVMELVEGPTLKDRLFKLAEQGKLLSLRDSLRIVREAASALAYAHSQNMVHRDVKPGNLMLDRDDRVVLADFGIAKIVTGQQFTATGGMVGTPAYMSPEQGLGEAGDERSDLYSLGVILYQLVTGFLPYDAETPLAVILKHLNDPIPSARTLRKDLPESVDGIIIRLMSKDPDSRYQTANELIADLEKLERGESLVGETASAIETTPPKQDYATIRLSQTRGGTGPLGLNPEAARSVEMPTPTPRSPSLHALTPPPPPRRRFPVWLTSLIAVLLIVIGIGGYWLGAQQGRFPVLAFLASPTTLLPTTTSTATATATMTPSAALTASRTPTEKPTATATSTDTPIPTATATPTSVPTDTLTPTITLTPSVTYTPSPDITQTVIQLTAILEIQTATTAACDFDYAIVEQDPKDGDFFPADKDYSRDITLLNTGTCPWERNTSLTFIEGESFNAEPRIFIRERVNVGEEVVLTFTGRTPATGASYTGTWELRTPGQIPIGEPLKISISVFEQGS